MLSPDLCESKCQQFISYTPYAFISQRDLCQMYIPNELYESGCIVCYQNYDQAL